MTVLQSRKPHQKMGRFFAEYDRQKSCGHTRMTEREAAICLKAGRCGTSIKLTKYYEDIIKSIPIPAGLLPFLFPKNT